MAWTSIPTSVYDIGKPITSISYGYLKENIEVHTHVAGQGGLVGPGGIDAGAVGQSEIKTPIETWLDYIEGGIE